MWSFVFDLLASFAASPPPIPITAGPPAAGLPEIQNLFIRLINISVPLGFMAVTVMFVIAGVQYVISGGDSKAIATAHGIVTWALLGVVMLVLSWLILLLIQSFTGVNVTQFNLAFPGLI